MRSCYRYFLLAVVLMLADQAYCQPKDSIFRSVTLSLGAAHYRFIDEAYAHQRARFRGTTFLSELTYQRSTNKHFLAIRANGGTGRTSADESQWPEAKMICIRLSAAYARCIAEHNASKISGRLYLGGQLASSNYAIENIKDHDELTLSFYHSVNLFAFYRAVLSLRDQLAFSLALPFAGFVKRESSDGGINQELEEQYKQGIIHLFTDDATFSAINPLRLPEIKIDFSRALRPKTDLMISYQFNFLKNTSIAPINLYSNTLLIGFRLKFDKQP